MASNKELSISDNPCLECSLHLARLNFGIIQAGNPCLNKEGYRECDRCSKEENGFTCTRITHPRLFTIAIALRDTITRFLENKSADNLAKTHLLQNCLLQAWEVQEEAEKKMQRLANFATRESA
ncbi:hypothetical protein FSPOR_2 [Fusarium sporotrichioides]|uniref:Uncharacterized protein n=1 Tax=Fusarium sporotrichioides TaxID=5514 RepID=A0A395SXC9_FUSSP|nr:hypothetical protein FSPOR_2 [Fusarium sporotrichioides]